MSSIRTQIYLTREQRRRLDGRARREDKTLAQVIREAVDAYVAEEPPSPVDALAATFGALPDLDVPPRVEWASRGG
jgi:Ribbon-helix-helix protein, copG family